MIIIKKKKKKNSLFCSLNLKKIMSTYKLSYNKDLPTLEQKKGKNYILLIDIMNIYLNLYKVIHMREIYVI